MIRQLLFLSAFACALQASAQNSCAEALTITYGLHTVDAINGPTVPSPLCAPNGTVGLTASEWYSFTAPEDTSLVLTTAPPGYPAVDTRFHVYTGTCGNLTCWSGDDDSGPGFSSIATFFVEEGVTYTIAFDNRWEDVGFTFSLAETLPPDTTTPPEPEEIISFNPITIPVSGNVMCVTDMDHDRRDDAVGVSNAMVSIAYQQANGTFAQVNTSTPAATYTASWSMCAGDLNGDTWNDLLYAAGSGVSIMLTAGNNGAYNEYHSTAYIFSQRSNMVDINNDGFLDAFVCHDVQPNVYFLNDGEGSFDYYQGGLGSQGGNYGSLWTDYDNDGDIDVFITRCAGNAWDGLMRNNGDGTYTDVATELGLADGHSAWSTAIGDFDNDADMDLMIGRSGSTYHKLMRNNGDGTFTNVTAGSGFDTSTGSGIEWITHDFNNDGYLDVLGSGGMLVNNGDMTFTQDVTTPQVGPIGDLNDDGFLDIMNGTTAHLNAGNDSTNYIRISTEGVVSNFNGIGARITITTPSGTQIREIRSGDGFRYMSTMTAHFGLGADEEVEQITVRWPSGIVDVITAPAINTTHHIVEGLTTGITSVEASEELELFPNPAVDVLTVKGPAGMNNVAAQVMDATGKQVLATTLRNGRLDVAGLSSGVYVLLVNTAEGTFQQRFTKQ